MCIRDSIGFIHYRANFWAFWRGICILSNINTGCIDVLFIHYFEQKTKAVSYTHLDVYKRQVLLNSVGTVISQSILSFGITKPEGSILEGFKDISIAIVSFVVASFLPRLGYQKAIIISLIMVSLACFIMPIAPSFNSAKILFFIIGVSFAMIKVSVYSSIGLITVSYTHLDVYKRQTYHR